MLTNFFYASGSPNPALTIIEGNTIIDPVNTRAITVRNQGPTIFINNIVRSRKTATAGPVAVFNSGHNADAYAAGNTFTIANPVSADSNSIQYNNKTIAVSGLKNVTEHKLPGVEPSLNRKVFEVPAGANAEIIQAIIDKAGKASGKRPVVHFPYGTYKISTTLFIPVNSDMQLTGDGDGNEYASMLIWSGTTPGPIIAIAGPSKATLRDITLIGNKGTTNILIANADQKNARVFLQGFNQAGGQVGLLANQLDHTLVLAYDTEFSGLKTAVDVIGGRLAETGVPAEGRTIVYSGAESGNIVSHQVSNGGNLMVQDTWYEGGNKSTYANLSGKGIFTADGDKVATPQHTEVPSVVLKNFSGKALFTAVDFTDRFALSGNCFGAKILVLGILAEDNPFVADTSSPKADIRVLLSRTRDYKPNISGSGSYPVADIGKYEPKFVNDMLSNMVSVHSTILTPLPKGTTDVRFYRVTSLNGARGLDIEGIATPEKEK